MPYFTSTGNTMLIARRGYGGQTPTGLSGVLDSIGSFVKNGVSAAINVYSSGQQAQGQAAAYQQVAQQQIAAQQAGRAPGWLMPVALIGGAAIVGGILLTRKRTNPARRRRRRR